MIGLDLSLIEALGVLEGVEKGQSGRWLAKCPATHYGDPEDPDSLTNAALEVFEGPNGVELVCGAGCSREVILDALGMLDGNVESASTNGNGAANGGVVVHAAPRGTACTTTRYQGRRVDLAALLAQPPKPLPWRVENLVADGTCTIVAGESGSGKSWLVQALCTGVARGIGVAGLPCTQGRALYVDAEMGPAMFVDQRLRPAGVPAPEFEYIDAMGLDFSTEHDLAWLRAWINDLQANLVVIDSLRRLTPSKAENDSDDMAPTVSAISKLARDTGAAIVLVHHKGDSDSKFYRGSTGIKDQCDALFGLLREDQEDEDNLVRRLRCRGGKGKMRYAPEPPDVFLTISAEDGGVAPADAPAYRSKAPTRDTVTEEILNTLPAKSKAEVASALCRPRNDRTFNEAWVALERDGLIGKEGGRFVVVVVSPPRDGDDDDKSQMSITTPNEEAEIGRITRKYGDS